MMRSTPIYIKLNVTSDTFKMNPCYNSTVHLYYMSTLDKIYVLFWWLVSHKILRVRMLMFFPGCVWLVVLSYIQFLLLPQVRPCRQDPWRPQCLGGVNGTHSNRRQARSWPCSGIKQNGWPVNNILGLQV